MEEALADGLKQELLFRIHPIVKIKAVGDDEVTEDDIAEWKAKRKERLKAEEEARKAAEEKAARGDDEEPKEGDEEEAE